MKKRTKTLLALSFALSLLPVLCLLLPALPAVLKAAKAPPLQKVQPWEWNERYEYNYIDYNNDGQMELITVGGEPGGYTDAYPEFKVYAYADGEVKQFEPTESGKAIAYSPEPYKNRRTQQRSFLSWNHPRYILRLLKIDTIDEVGFDFETYQYDIVKTRKYYVLFPFSRPFARRGYHRAWEWEKYDSEVKKGDILTPERIEELLLNPPN